MNGAAEGSGSQHPLNHFITAAGGGRLGGGKVNARQRVLARAHRCEWVTDMGAAHHGGRAVVRRGQDAGGRPGFSGRPPTGQRWPPWRWPQDLESTLWPCASRRVAVSLLSQT